MGIDYEAISQAIVDLLQTAIPTATVLTEPAEVGLTEGTEIGVTLISEDNTEDDIGSADPYMTQMRYSIFCTEYSVDGVLEAIKKRNTLVNTIRQTFKEDPGRNLGNRVGFHQLATIEYETAQGETADFWAAANIELVVTLMA